MHFKRGTIQTALFFLFRQLTLEPEFCPCCYKATNHIVFLHQLCSNQIITPITRKKEMAEAGVLHNPLCFLKGQKEPNGESEVHKNRNQTTVWSFTAKISDKQNTSILPDKGCSRNRKEFFFFFLIWPSRSNKGSWTDRVHRIFSTCYYCPIQRALPRKGQIQESLKREWLICLLWCQEKNPEYLINISWCFPSWGWLQSILLWFLLWLDLPFNSIASV